MSLSEFLHMGGYGFYVWTAYGTATVLLALNTLLPVLRHRRLVREFKDATGASNS